MRYAATAALLSCAVLLSGCVQNNSEFNASTGEGNPGLFSFDFSARGSVPKIGYGDRTQDQPRTAQVYPGSAPVPTQTPGQAQTAVHVADADGQFVPNTGGFQLNFDNADVETVCKAILGDILQANYLVDRRVAGQITLTSSQPVPRARLVPLLESSLQSIGASLVKEQDLYRVVPSADPGGIVGQHGQTSAEGFGTSVIAAHFMPAANLGHLLEDFGSRAGSVRVDPGTNLVIIQGSSVERQAAMEAANLVDVDWLRARSVAILPVSNVAPDTVISELNHILDTGEGGMAQSAIQFQPLNRMNAVLVVSRQRNGIDLAKRWVARLDRLNANAAGVKVYKLEYAQAKNVAAMLNDLFGGGSGNSSDKDALEPSVKPSTQTGAPSVPGLTSASIGQSGQSGTSNAAAGATGFGGLQKATFTPDSGKGEASNPTSADAADPFHQGSTQKVHVTADPVSNELLISANAIDYQLIERAIRQMDRPPVQVQIEATIAEVTLTQDLQYGIQFYLHNTDLGAGLAGAAGFPTSSSIAQGLNLLVGKASSPRVLLQALQNVTDVKILSSPSLVVLDRQPAVLQVGDQVPILTKSAQAVDTSSTAPIVNSVDYKDTGIILNVLPRVNANGVVTLDVEQEISAVTSTDPTLTPTISERRVHSSIAVANGQTVMLAGLISEKQSHNRSGLPGLSSISFLNDILTSHGSARDRTEIVIFIHPQVITSSADAQQVTREFYDRLTSMHRQSAPVLYRK